MFFFLLTSIVTLLHFYCAWRIKTLVYKSVGFYSWWIGVAGIWLIWLVGLKVVHDTPGPLLTTLANFSFIWLGILILTSLCLLTIDLLTGFGHLFKNHLRVLRTIALVTAALLIVLSMVQGMRLPVITRYQVPLENLPPELNGMVIVALSDLHLGIQRNAEWLGRRIAQVEALKPDIIILLGDSVEVDPRTVPGLAEELAKLHAPLGVWAITGNHEFYGNNIDATVQMFSSAGIQWLRDESAIVAPGLTLIGRDDNHHAKSPVPLSQIHPKSLQNTISILLSHRPNYVQQAADEGINLMLSGHTHGGQIWPNDFLVRLVYPYLVGQYRIGAMTLLVCRGTGAWGPSMRLWQPSEILHITLSFAYPTL